MDDIIVRVATVDDADAACAVLVRSITEICAPHYNNDEEILTAWLGNKTPQNVRRWIGSERCYSVIAVAPEDRAVGFASIVRSEITLNYVVLEVLHRGVGKRMLQELEHHAKAAGVKRIRVVSTIPTETFYRRNGYVSDGPPRRVGHLLGDFPLVKSVVETNA